MAAYKIPDRLLINSNLIVMFSSDEDLSDDKAFDFLLKRILNNRNMSLERVFLFTKANQDHFCEIFEKILCVIRDGSVGVQLANSAFTLAEMLPDASR